MKYDVIIIGSGLGGLECAHILSNAGMNVLILEQDKQPGGCLQSYSRNGLSFDTGFHYVGGLEEGQSLHAAFRMLGLLNLPWKKLDNDFDRIMIGNRNFSYSQGYENFTESLVSYFYEEREAIKKYVNLLKNTGQQQLDMLNPDIETDTFSSSMFETSAWKYLTETFHDHLLINVLSATSLKMELRKDSLPLFTFLHGNGSFIESSWRLKGNGTLIADSLIEDIKRNGGNIICSAEVNELVEKDRKIVCAKCSNGEVYEGNIFISNAHPSITSGWIKQSECIRNTYRKRIDSLENTFGMLTVSLIIKPQTLKYFNWNQYIYKNDNVWDFYENNESVSGILISASVPENEGGYLRQIDILTPLMWKKCIEWENTYIGHRGDSYKEMKERMAEECILLAEKAIPGLRDMVEKYYVSTPLTYRDYTSTPQGSAFGIRKDYNSPMTTILSPRTPINNLLLTGQNLILHGIHGVTMTSLFTCSEILGKKYIWNKLN